VNGGERRERVHERMALAEIEFCETLLAVVMALNRSLADVELALRARVAALASPAPPSQLLSQELLRERSHLRLLPPRD
jgi:hypothetical protein